MSKKFSFQFQIILKVWFISLLLNAAVAIDHLYTVVDLSEPELGIRISAFFVFLLMSALTFLPVYLIVLLLINRFAAKGMKWEKVFWIMMCAGLILTTISFTLIDELWKGYSYHTPSFISIAVFSALVSISTVYESFELNAEQNISQQP